jgi:hypothetical protein
MLPKQNRFYFNNNLKLYHLKSGVASSDFSWFYNVWGAGPEMSVCYCLSDWRGFNYSQWPKAGGESNRPGHVQGRALCNSLLSSISSPCGEESVCGGVVTMVSTL